MEDKLIEIAGRFDFLEEWSLKFISEIKENPDCCDDPHGTMRFWEGYNEAIVAAKDIIEGLARNCKQ